MICLLKSATACSVLLLYLLSVSPAGALDHDDKPLTATSTLPIFEPPDLQPCRGWNPLDPSKCPTAPTDHPVGIYLGPSQLTSARYNVSDSAIALAKVAANPEWTDWTLHAAQRGIWDCQHEIENASNPDPYWGTCGEILPAFLAAMRHITNATSETLGGKPFKIGFVVLPHNLTVYSYLIDVIMHRKFEFEHWCETPNDYIELDIIPHTEAAQLAYNLTTPDTLGVPWAPGGRDIWREWGPSHVDDIFTEPSNSILVLNFEPDFLEISYHCVQRDCEEVPRVKKALFHLGEKSIWRDDRGADMVAGNVQVPLSRSHGRQVEILSSAIAEFVNRTSSPAQRRNLRAAVVMGGASPKAMDALHRALPGALPFLEPWRIKTSIDPAFVPSLGVALRMRNEMVDWYENFCKPIHDPLPPPF